MPTDFPSAEELAEIGRQGRDREQVGRRALLSFLERLRGVTQRELRDVASYRPAHPAAVPRRLAEKVAERVSVKDFGAVADGASDDTAAFNRALAEAGNAHVPRGNYAIEGTIRLPAGARLHGDGFAPWLDQGSKLIRHGPSTAPMLASQGNGWTVQGLYLECRTDHPDGIILLGAPGGALITQYCLVEDLFIQGRNEREGNIGIKLHATAPHASYYNRLSNLFVTSCGTGLLFLDEANGNVGTNIVTLSCRRHLVFDRAVENSLGPLGFFGAAADAQSIGPATCITLRNGAANNVLGPFAAETSSGGRLYDIDASSRGLFFGADNEVTGSRAKGWLNEPLPSSQLLYTPAAATTPAALHAALDRAAFGARGVLGRNRHAKALLLPGGFSRRHPFVASLTLRLVAMPPYLAAPVSAELSFAVGNRHDLSGITVDRHAGSVSRGFADWIEDVQLWTAEGTEAGMALVVKTSDHPRWGEGVFEQVAMALEALYTNLNTIDRGQVSLENAELAFLPVSAAERRACVSLLG